MRIGNKTSELIKPKAYRFECENCQKHFTHLKNLKSHHKCHTNEDKKKNRYNAVYVMLRTLPSWT
ncbi:hypothetical protein NQ314_018043 [Rhamnusium bicolor]|uniref:C2H2-type domain-containing protein n=1 Tax=Rhamnusium bicolor TaxID=1586634 RepID=A0AAV8WRV8_9CUCU|nr:hypothetical protein NQ314_018043 [Rhamnusium bicolor]